MISVDPAIFIPLSTDRLYLRFVRATDRPAIFQLRSDPAIMRYLDRPLAARPEDVDGLVNSIQDGYKTGDNMTWALTLKGQDTLIGTIGFWKIDTEHHRAEIGYLLNPGFQGQGLMQEATKTVLDFGFETMLLHSVEANVNPDNQRSINLLERLNFVREAYYKENYFYNGRFLDSAIYSLLTPHR